MMRGFVTLALLLASSPSFAEVDSVARGLAARAASFLQNGTGAVSRTVNSRLKDRPISPRDYGAACDGSTDSGAETAAIAQWAANLSIYKRGYIPGICLTQSPIVFPVANGISVSGDGADVSGFVYTGATTTGDIIQIGDGVTQVARWQLEGFFVRANTVMTSGAGLHLRRFARGNLTDIRVGGQDYARNLYDGVWFDKVDTTTFTNYDVRSSHDAVTVNGTVGAGQKADLWLNAGRILQSGRVGLHVAGGFGGLYVNGPDIIGNATNVLIDTALAAEANRELFFSSTTAIDGSTTGCGVEVNDLLAGAAGFLSFDGTWLASSHTHNLCVDAGVASSIVYNGGTIFNAQQDGVNNQSVNSRIMLSQVYIRNNGLGGAGYGVNNAVDNSNLITKSISYLSNASGNFSGLTSTPVSYGSGVLYQNSIAMDAASPTLQLRPVGGTQPADQKNWDILEGSSTGSLAFRALNDAFSASTTWLSVSRTGYTTVIPGFLVPLKLPAYTVAGLPTCNSGLTNAMAVATDATAPTYNGALTGGGGVRVPVFCNGSAWSSH